VRLPLCYFVGSGVRPGSEPPPTGDGHGVGRRTKLFGHRHDCCAVQPHAPTDSARRRWGMGCGGHGQSLNADRSFRRTPCPSGMGVIHVGGESPRPRHSADSLRRQSDRVRCAGDVMGRARRWTANGLVRSSPRLLRRPTPCPNAYDRRSLGHGVRREPAMFNADRSFRRTPCPSGI
jgi:hypothetical protein